MRDSQLRNRASIRGLDASFARQPLTRALGSSTSPESSQPRHVRPAEASASYHSTGSLGVACTERIAASSVSNAMPTPSASCTDEASMKRPR